MPQCSYTIRKDEIDGEILRYARVGDQVVHRWQCDTDIFGILVHSCYVEDGQGQRVHIVDENGCHRDRFILGDPTYVEKLNMAYRESHVFKFADRLTVRFQCQIRLCVKFDDGCRGITPPICSSPLDSSAALLLGNGTLSNTTSAGFPSNTSTFGKFRFRNLFARRHKRSAVGDRGVLEMVDGDFVSQDLYVLESTENPEQGPFNHSEPWKRLVLSQRQSQGGVCLSLPIFTSLVSLVVITMMSVTLTGFCIMVQRHRHNQKSDHESASALSKMLFVK